MIELDKVWAQEEADRLKHGAVKNEGQNKKRRAPVRKPKAAGEENKRAKAPAAKEAKPRKKIIEEETKEPAGESLRERMMAKLGNNSKDLERAKTSLFSGKDGLTQT